ncbi:MAG: hypothetical protein AAGE52_27755 [Myxococcota bacterium]
MRSVVCLAVLLGATTVQADTAEDLANYLRLRDRLQSEFVIEGEGQGEGIPAHLRIEEAGLVRWADATIDLGWYMGVLATELAMLDAPTRYPGLTGNADETAERLYEALAALERLDRIADASFVEPECTQAESLNGFFIRDDVPGDFHLRFGATQTRSDFLDPVVTNKEMSQDQVWHLMLGLSLTARFAGERTVRGRRLQSWAREQALRIMAFVAEDDWRISNPACGDRSVARGSGAVGNAPGGAAIVEFLSEGGIPANVQPNQQRLFDTLQDPEHAVYINPDNMHMVMTIVAVGRGFGDESAASLMALAEVHDWWLYPLLYGALRTDEEAPRWCMHRVRASAGAATLLGELGANEPRSPQPARAEHSFTTSNRFIRPSDFAYVGMDGSEGHRYHGLDFMLLHNLRAIADPNSWEGGDAPGPGACRPVPPDAGVPDAGSDAAVDAGASDAGEMATGGGGCAVSSSTSGPLAGLFALLWFRRRR